MKRLGFINPGLRTVCANIECGAIFFRHTNAKSCSLECHAVLRRARATKCRNNNLAKYRMIDSARNKKRDRNDDMDRYYENRAIVAAAVEAGLMTKIRCSEITVRTCPCGVTFESSDGKKKFCTTRCKNRFNRQNERWRALGLTENVYEVQKSIVMTPAQREAKIKQVAKAMKEILK